jgi:hypothetical protein
MPPLGLDRCLLPLARDLCVQPPRGQRVAGLARVVSGVEVHGDFLGQRAELAELVQGRGEQRRVVPVGPASTRPSGMQ